MVNENGAATRLDGPTNGDLASMLTSTGPDQVSGLCEEYRASAAGRALRITQLLDEVDRRDSKIRRLRGQLEQTQSQLEQAKRTATRLERERDLAAGDLHRLRRRRGVRVGLHLAAVLKRLRSNRRTGKG